MHPVATLSSNQQRSQFVAAPSNSFNNISPAKTKSLKPRPPLHPAADRPSSAPHSPPATGADASAEGAAIAPFSDPPAGIKVPSVHTQMRMHMRLNAGEAMGGGGHDRFNSQPPPKVTLLLLMCCHPHALAAGPTQRHFGVEWATATRATRRSGSICNVSACVMSAHLSSCVSVSTQLALGMMTACLPTCGVCRQRMAHRLHAREGPSCDSNGSSSIVFLNQFCNFIAAIKGACCCDAAEMVALALSAAGIRGMEFYSHVVMFE